MKFHSSENIRLEQKRLKARKMMTMDHSQSLVKLGPPHSLGNFHLDDHKIVEWSDSDIPGIRHKARKETGKWINPSNDADIQYQKQEDCKESERSKEQTRTELIEGQAPDSKFQILRSYTHFQESDNFNSRVQSSSTSYQMSTSKGARSTSKSTSNRTTTKSVTVSGGEFEALGTSFQPLDNSTQRERINMSRSGGLGVRRPPSHKRHTPVTPLPINSTSPYESDVEIKDEIIVGSDDELRNSPSPKYSHNNLSIFGLKSSPKIRVGFPVEIQLELQKKLRGSSYFARNGSQDQSKSHHSESNNVKKSEKISNQAFSTKSQGFSSDEGTAPTAHALIKKYSSPFSYTPLYRNSNGIGPQTTTTTTTIPWGEALHKEPIPYKWFGPEDEDGAEHGIGDREQEHGTDIPIRIEKSSELKISSESEDEPELAGFDVDNYMTSHLYERRSQEDKTEQIGYCVTEVKSPSPYSPEISHTNVRLIDLYDDEPPISPTPPPYTKSKRFEDDWMRDKEKDWETQRELSYLNDYSMIPGGGGSGEDKSEEELTDVNGNFKHNLGLVSQTWISSGDDFMKPSQRVRDNELTTSISGTRENILKGPKKVEFCKTEVHFTADSGKFHIVETDENKPSTTHLFRKRRKEKARELDHFETANNEAKDENQVVEEMRGEEGGTVIFDGESIRSKLNKILSHSSHTDNSNTSTPSHPIIPDYSEMKIQKYLGHLKSPGGNGQVPTQIFTFDQDKNASHTNSSSNMFYDNGSFVPSATRHSLIEMNNNNRNSSPLKTGSARMEAKVATGRANPQITSVELKYEFEDDEKDLRNSTDSNNDVGGTPNSSTYSSRAGRISDLIMRSYLRIPTNHHSLQLKDEQNPTTGHKNLGFPPQSPSPSPSNYYRKAASKSIVTIGNYDGGRGISGGVSLINTEPPLLSMDHTWKGPAYEKLQLPKTNQNEPEWVSKARDRESRITDWELIGKTSQEEEQVQSPPWMEEVRCKSSRATLEKQQPQIPKVSVVYPWQPQTQQVKGEDSHILSILPTPHKPHPPPPLSTQDKERRKEERELRDKDVRKKSQENVTDRDADCILVSSPTQVKSSGRIERVKKSKSSSNEIVAPVGKSAATSHREAAVGVLVPSNSQHKSASLHQPTVQANVIIGGGGSTGRRKEKAGASVKSQQFLRSRDPSTAAKDPKDAQDAKFESGTKRERKTNSSIATASNSTPIHRHPLVKVSKLPARNNHQLYDGLKIKIKTNQSESGANKVKMADKRDNKNSQQLKKQVESKFSK